MQAAAWSPYGRPKSEPGTPPGRELLQLPPVGSLTSFLQFLSGGCHLVVAQAGQFGTNALTASFAANSDSVMFKPV